METIKWDNANALEIGMLMEMAEDGYVFCIEDGKIQAVEVRIFSQRGKADIMYYKDDFYKEFRTEKELCEYLEEIDSRAEWIRITSKKLKVAAAGEETCTEVPGISLDWRGHSG